MTVTAIKPTTDAKQVAADLRLALDEIGDEFLERREDAEGLIITLLAKANAYLLGERGIAKSALCRRVREIFPEAVWFEKLMTNQLPDTALFGQVDVPLFKQTGDWQRRSKGKAQEAHVLFLDELGKVGDTVLNPLLTLAVDGLFDDDVTGEMIPTPKIMIVGASNEVLEMPRLSAMWDRFDFRKFMKPIQQPANRKALMESAFKPRVTATKTTVPLADLLYVVEEVVPRIVVPDRILESLMAMYAKLAGAGIVPTDRRQKRVIGLMQASAFLNDRDVVDDDDVAILQYGLWENETEIDKVTSEVLALVSQGAKEAMNVISWVEEQTKEIDARKGQANRSLAKFATDTRFDIDIQRKKLAKLIEEAEKEKRSTARLKTAADAVQVLRLKVMTDLMKTPADRAIAILDAEDGR